MSLENGVVDIAKYKSHIDPALLSTVNERRNINDDDNLFSDCLLNKCMKDRVKMEKLTIQVLWLRI